MSHTVLDIADTVGNGKDLHLTVLCGAEGEGEVEHKQITKSVM